MPQDIVPSFTEIPVRFKPRARLLSQLGDQLIKNEYIAIIELVKNAYDADATKVDIYMENVDQPGAGLIIIEDDGFGMDSYIVENVWMEPGSDFKAEKFQNKEVTPKFKRLPIGEKGIGRFGVHKLGHRIEMTTKKKDSKEVFVSIDWRIFENFRYLEEVPIKIIEREVPQHFKQGKSGTNIVISDLRNEITRGLAREVKRAITSLTSPFESNDAFVADFDVTDKPGWLDGLLDWAEVKHYALYNFKIRIKDDRIVDFRYKFMPWPSMSRLSERDEGNNSAIIQQFSLLKNSNDVRFSLSDYKIGEVNFEGYIFDRDAFVLRLGVTDKKGFKEYLDNNCGIRVFRDGLRIYDYGERENDWLGLDLRRVNNPTKSISNNIVLGAVYLNRADSSDLIEKTNREGFVENGAYVAFKDSIIHCIEIIETYRYTDKLRLREMYGPTPKSEPVLQVLGDLQEYVERNVKDSDVKVQIKKYLVKIESDYKRINENLLKAAGAGLSMSVVIHEVEKIILEVQKVLKAEAASERVVNLVQHLSSLIDGYSEIIKKSTQTNEDLKKVIDQALFNTEYRIASHQIEILPAYRNYTGKSKTQVARSLLIGSLMNLIDNSIYWLEKSGKQDKKIFLDIVDSEKYLNIIFADNGTGFIIPTEDITEPFVSGKPGGMGLGLHIVNEIMIAQGGRIDFPDPTEFELPKDFYHGAIIALTFKK